MITTIFVRFAYTILCLTKSFCLKQIALIALHYQKDSTQEEEEEEEKKQKKLPNSPLSIIQLLRGTRGFQLQVNSK
jgi:quinol-cytochrome oxidoreductase complex cytochrome b subunit